MHAERVCILALVFIILFLCQGNKKSISYKKPRKERFDAGMPKNINDVAIRRYARYDPYYFSYDMKECYLATHYNGHVTRGFGNENWHSHRFNLICAGDGLYYIKTKELGYYLYIDCETLDVKSEKPCKGPSKKHMWSVQTDHMDRTVIRHPASGNRFLALSCADGNAYARLDYANDTVFRLVMP